MNFSCAQNITNAYAKYADTASFALKKSVSYQSAYTATTTNAAVPVWRKGDMVQHTAFGRGMVLSVLKMSGDALLEIAFDDVGTKKLMAKTASAHMKKL